MRQNFYPWETFVAHESLFQGLIDAGEATPHGRAIHPLNRLVIESLPGGPEHIIQREMFAIVEPPVSFRSQLIHFAGSFNYIEELWDAFLSDFEALIVGMYWYGVDFHIHFDQLGREYSYSWVVNKQGLAELHSDPPRPTRFWDFSGGPRELPRPNSQGIVPPDTCMGSNGH